MAEVSVESKGKGGKGKPKKLSTRVDFTPMVDLGFLLITFFMLTTTMIKPQTMEIAMPSKEVPKGPVPAVKASRAVTIILSKEDKVYYWEGKEENGKKPEVNVTDFSATGLRKYLILRNIDVMKKVQDLRKEKEVKSMPDSVFERKKKEVLKEDKISPQVIIKATDEATYKDLIDVFDEMAICNIGTYTLVDITPEDLDMIKNVAK